MVLRRHVRVRTVITIAVVSAVLSSMFIGLGLLRHASDLMLGGRALSLLAALFTAGTLSKRPDVLDGVLRAASILWLAGLGCTIAASGGSASPYFVLLNVLPCLVALLLPDDTPVTGFWSVSCLAIGLWFLTSSGKMHQAFAFSAASTISSVYIALSTIRSRKERAVLDAQVLSEARRVTETLNVAAAKLVWVRSEDMAFDLAREAFWQLGLDPQLMRSGDVDVPRSGRARFPVKVEGVEVAVFSLSAAADRGDCLAAVGLFIQSVAGALENVRHLARARDQVEEVRRLQLELVNQSRLAAVGEATAVLAHEVRNPLGTIVNAVSLLNGSLDPGTRAQVLSIIKEDSQRLERLMEDLLFLARPLELRCREVNLTELAQGAVGSVLRPNPATGGQRAQIETRASPHIYGDAGQLLIVLENLIRNALQAISPQGRIALCVEGNEQWAVLVVEDDGPGLPEARCERIFEPFFSTRAKGTGLGLAIVQRIVKAHGGTITAGKSPLGGARFELSLPRSLDAHVSQRAASGA